MGGGTEVTPDTLFFRVRSSRPLKASCRIGDSLGMDKTNIFNYIVASSASVVEASIAGVKDNFFKCQWRSHSLMLPGDGTLWIHIKVMDGSNSRMDVGAATYTDSYYVNGDSTPGHASFYLSFETRGKLSSAVPKLLQEIADGNARFE